MVTIRAATEEDLEAILQIETHSFPAPWNEAAFQIYFQFFPDLFFIASKDGTTVGYIIASIHQEANNRRIGHLDSIAVAQPYRRQSIGRQLMMRIFRAFEEKGCQEALLVVRVSNQAAQQLYRSFGFQVKSRLNRFYEGEDGFVMVKNLEGDL
ncbi:MAG: ribosomal protein S18-alanine N-acetyltransferase [Candidatus Hodarchaeota archaeon]